LAPPARDSATPSRGAAACGAADPSAASSSASSARRAWNASETYFRNTSARITSLYWEASIEPRSLSAAFHNVSLSSFIVLAVLGVATACFLRGGTAFLILLRAPVRPLHLLLPRALLWLLRRP